MNDPLLVLGIAEAVLFLAAFGLLCGTDQITPRRRKTGHVLLILWLTVLATCIVWIVMGGR